MTALGSFFIDGFSSIVSIFNCFTMSPSTLLFVIVGRNEPLYEAEFHKRGATTNSDAATRQNYFVLHSALDLVEKTAWTTNSMYLKVVDKVRPTFFVIYVDCGSLSIHLSLVFYF
mmetsp:Transcript_9111/g.20549  ORF Transcript_9111/g.20549 Transcript_9111/m.20549 type:complete len:115 (-) Transcript_9111:301-645(-)